MIRFIAYFLLSISLLALLTYNSGVMILEVFGYEVYIQLFFVIPSIIIIIAILLKVFFSLGKAGSHRNINKQIEAVSQLLQGLSYVKMGDSRSASVFINRANKVLSEQPVMKLLIANNELLQGNKEYAKKYLKEIIIGDSELLVVAINQFLNIAYSEKNFLEVERIIHQIQTKFPQEPWSLLKQAEFYCSIKQYHRALNLFVRIKKYKLQLGYDVIWRISMLHYALAKESYTKHDYHHALFCIAQVESFTGSILLQAHILFDLNKKNKAQDLLFSEYTKNPHRDILNLYLELGGDMTKIDVLQDDQDKKSWQCTNCYLKTDGWDFICNSCDQLGTLRWL